MTETKAPERIWAIGSLNYDAGIDGWAPYSLTGQDWTSEGSWDISPDIFPEICSPTEYVRADIASARLAAAVEQAADIVERNGHSLHVEIRALADQTDRDALAELIKAAVKAEREACAQIAEKFHNEAVEWAKVHVKSFDGETDSRRIAAAIRARGGKCDE